MKQAVLSLLVLLMISVSAKAQTIRGKLVDLVDSRPLAGASLSITSIKDTLAIRNSIADSTGSFLFSGVAIDSYFLKVSYIGYEDFRQVVGISDSLPDLNLGTLFIPKSTRELSGVTVAARTPPTQQKGDTVQYNASQFKVNPDATVEDLVRKAPGITVDRDGTVTAQGEQVRKVTIDGRDFFGDDASAALRNLPADVVDKIQVFDRLSDQAQFTGVDDGNSQKALNIVTKAGMSNGQFGRFFAGYGTDERYQLGGNVSFFKGNRRVSLVGLSNNINQQNFASQDLLGLTSSGGGRGGGGRGGGGGRNFGGGSGNFTVGQQSGIARTNAFGINFSDKWGSKVDVAGSYFFNNSNLNNDRFTNRQGQAKPDSILFSDETALTRSNNYNHRVNLRVEYKIDSANTIIITPNISFQKNKSISNSYQRSYYDLSSSLLSELINDRNVISDGLNFNNNILYRHAFKKRGRTISLNLNTSLNNRDGETYQNSLARYYTDGGKSDTLVQFTDNETRGRTINTNVVYTEPVGKMGQLQFNYNPTFTSNKADKQTLRQDDATGKYSILDSTLSNIFDNTYNTQAGGVTYRIGDRDNQFAIGANYQYSVLKSDQLFPQAANINRSFSNVIPNLQFRRKLSPRSSLRVFYRARVSPPSVNQLQNVIDNTNPLFVTAGNPDLEQEYTHTLSTRYTFTNTQLGQSFFANLFLQKTTDYVTNAVYTAFRDSVLTPSVTLYEGSQLIKPVNLDGYLSMRSYLTFGQPIKAIKSNLNLNAEFTYNRIPGLANNLETITNEYRYGAGAVIASNVSEYVDFTVSYTANFSRVRNKQQRLQNTNFVNRVASLQMNLLSRNGWFLQHDVTNQVYTGLSDGYNPNYWLWNAAAGKKFLKDRRGELKLSVFDLLKQNQSISRTVSGVDIIDERNTVLQRYFMLTFTYSLKNFGTARSSGPQRGPRPQF